jgi:hypothetical protein
VEAQRGGLWKQLRKSAISGGTFFFQLACTHTHTVDSNNTSNSSSSRLKGLYRQDGQQRAEDMKRGGVCVSQAITTARSTVVVLKREEEEKRGAHTRL